MGDTAPSPALLVTARYGPMPPAHGRFGAEWERCATWLASALEVGPATHDLADVRAMVLRDDAQFWPGRLSAVVTEFHHYPRLLALHHWLCGGSLAELKLMQPAVQAWAARHGVRLLMGTGRKGWGRALTSQGFQPVGEIFAKEI